jgi:hypothetical protein
MAKHTRQLHKYKDFEITLQTQVNWAPFAIVDL